MTPRVLWLLPLLALSWTACSKPDNGAPSESATPNAPAASPATNAPPVAAPTSKDPVPAQAAATSEAPIAALSSKGEAVPEGGAGGAASVASIDFDLPSGWQTETPSSSMRLAQASIPGKAGAGTFAVFYFGPGGGGGVDANLKRWVEQMEPAPGFTPRPETFETSTGYRINLIDVPGTLKASTMGAGPTTAQAGARLLGAVVEGPGGPWFFKATGPDATIEGGRNAFVGMLRSIRSK
jgi:hypothetical protein